MSPGLSTTKVAGAWALNCYLPDQSIPGSPAHGRMVQSLYELFGKPVPPKPANDTKSQKKGKKTK